MPNLAPSNICTGCCACLSSCVHDAISMREDGEGFMIPFINEHKCIGCGVCERSCPVFAARNKDYTPLCYAAKSNDAELVRQSSSGGLFSEFAMKILAKGGVVYGSAYVGENLHVKHIRVDSVDDLSLLRGSKYVYSETNEIYRAVKADLGVREVLFSGTPCQIAGLKSFLKGDSDNLLTVEVICHGVPPARLFNDLKSEMYRRHGKLIAISFRDKSEGWTSRAVTGWYASGEKIREGGSVNEYFKAFIAHLTLRHSCTDCRFNDGRSGADVTLGDFWGVESVIMEMSDNTGVSAVILHTKKGENAFSEITCFKRRVQIADITAGNPSYNEPRKPEKNRDKFMELAFASGISAAYNKFRPSSRVAFMRRLISSLINSVRWGGVGSVSLPTFFAEYKLCA